MGFGLFSDCLNNQLLSILEININPNRKIMQMRIYLRIILSYMAVMCWYTIDMILIEANLVSYKIYQHLQIVKL